MAEVLFDKEGVRIWMDGASPIIFVKFVYPPQRTWESVKLIRKCQQTLDSLMVKADSVYSIIDISECADHCALTLLQTCFTHFPQLLKPEIRYLAVVHAPTHQPAIQDQLTGLPIDSPGQKRGCFLDFFSALGKINMIRQRQFSIHL